MKKIRNGHGVKASFATCIVAASSLMLGHAETTVFNSLAQGPGGVPVYDFHQGPMTYSYSWAQGFKSIGSGYMTSIVLHLFNTGSLYNAAASSGPLTVALYSASGPDGSPGSELTAFSGPSPANISDGDYTFTPDSSIWIQTGTDYDVVVKDSGYDNTDYANPPGYSWDLGITTEGISEGSYGDLNASGWGVEDANLGMEVTATPEPGTMALAGAGAAGLLIARRRKQK